MDENQVTPIETVVQALDMVPDAHLMLVTIVLTEGGPVRTDAAILRPVAATEVFNAELVAQYAGLACLAFQWIETLQPMYTGHPGSVWPIQTAHQSPDGRLTFAGPLGVATIRLPDANLAARLGGWVDAQGDVLLSTDGPRTLLPLNRKERFYTGTVLPMIATGAGFTELHRLLAVCGLADISLDDPAAVQFFTEYSFAESVFTEDDQSRFKHRPLNADTPDVVISGPGWLLAIEAKMFHRPNAASLNAQYQRQSALVDYWAARLGPHPDLVRHVLLLPRALAEKTATAVTAPVVTWESVHDAYRNTAPVYWLDVLRHALDSYDKLASKDSLWGQNAQQKLPGGEIVAAWKSANPLVAWVGRAGGLTGKLLAADVDSGAWRSQPYEVSSTPPSGKAANWFPVAEFIALVTGSPQAAPTSRRI